MTDDFDWQALDRVLAGDASPADEQRVRDWMSRSPDRRAMVESLQRDRAAGISVDVDRAWQKVASRTVRTTNREWRRGIGWLAAAVVVIAAGSLLSARMLRTTVKTLPAPVASWHEVTASLGQRTSITLPDSSRIVLNAGSSLRYPSTFGQAEREVQLTGEGYFAVRHDATRPFRVRANNTEVEDVGTRFVVRAYDSVHGTTVVVAEGSVGIAAAGSHAHDTVVVTPGILAHVTPTGAITTSRVDASRYTGFSNGLLVLGDLTLAEAIPVIERWYDVKVYADSALTRRQLSADFRNEPLPNVLSALGLALDANVRQSGRLVTISPRAR